ncbi:hypothetical protein ACN4EK_25885 [Pantanalinema rosaneae CENA516]|uniref:hypothetical protein n=1 Tax=Pantanalinema rosaneae TaxID=1620701 RepID=UPI003D6F8A32
MDIFTATVHPTETPADELARLQLEIAVKVQRWTNGKLLATLGFLNNLLYCAAKQLDVFAISAFPKRTQVCADRVHHLLEPISLTVPVTYSAKFLDTFWGAKATTSASSVRRIRDALSTMFGLFTYEKQAGPSNHTGQPWQRATYHNFDIPKALVVYEQLEKTWIAREGFDSLPKHKGFSCKLLYDAVFSCTLGMNRSIPFNVGTIGCTPKVATQRRQRQRRDTVSRRRNELLSLKLCAEQYRRLGLDQAEPEQYQEFQQRIEQLSGWFESPDVQEFLKEEELSFNRKSAKR